MNFKQFLTEGSTLDIPDPTGLGLEIKAILKRVPGMDGKGAYSGELQINTPDKVGGLITFTDFYHSVEATQTALRELLQKRHTVSVTKRLLNSKKTGKLDMSDDSTLVPIEIMGLKSTGTHQLEPRLGYGSAWNPEYLKKEPGYDPEKHEKHMGFMRNIQGVVDGFKKEMKDVSRRTRKFGDGPPVSGQFLTKEDIILIPDIIETFGDFKVVLKWARRPRQILNAKDFYKHYDRITKDAEVKTGDYIREVWVL